MKIEAQSGMFHFYLEWHVDSGARRGGSVVALMGRCSSLACILTIDSIGLLKLSGWQTTVWPGTGIQYHSEELSIQISIRDACSLRVWEVVCCMPLDWVGHPSRRLLVLARYWLWGSYPTFVDWITLVTKPGQLRISVCHTALYRLAVFTVSGVMIDKSQDV